jgi:hypothetical protein
LPLRDQSIGTSAKGHGTKIFLQHVFMGLQVFLAEFGKTYIIFIEIRVSKCTFWEPSAISTGYSVARDQVKFIRG